MVPVVIVDWNAEAAANLALLLTGSHVAVEVMAAPTDYFASDVFHDPHVAVISLKQEGFAGLDVVRHAVAQSRAIAVFAVIDEADTHNTVAAIKAGARDVLERPVPTHPILKVVSGSVDSVAAAKGTLVGTLTKREQDVLGRLTAGLSNADTARQLGVSVRTVESHRARIYTKLGVNSQTELIRKLEV